MTDARVIRVEGLDDARRQLARFADDDHLEAELADTDYQAAQVVIRYAQNRASTAQQRRAAGTLTPERRRRRAAVGLGGRYGFELGAEFGAQQNMRRVIKTSAYHRIQRRNARASGRRASSIGRSTLVRDDEDIDAVIARIQAQTVSSDGTTVNQRFRDSGANPVVAAGVRRGWNQFPEWRGSGRRAGYFLYPGIRAATDDVVDLYADALPRILRPVFPD